MKFKLKKIRNFLRFILKCSVILFLDKVLLVYRYYTLPSIFSLTKIKYSKETSSFFLKKIKIKLIH